MNTREALEAIERMRPGLIDRFDLMKSRAVARRLDQPRTAYQELLTDLWVVDNPKASKRVKEIIWKVRAYKKYNYISHEQSVTLFRIIDKYKNIHRWKL